MATLSVIVPATDRPPTLLRATAAIARAAAPPEQLIVVDDPPGLSAASARNAGALRARGDLLVFVDADVEVHPDAFARIRAAFDADPALTAVFGSYDDAPGADGTVSAFRNLLHHHVHHSGAGPAETFWAGLGAVRREAFVAAGGFDAGRFPHPSIEDIELGARLAAGGARLRLDPTIQGKHLKVWTVGRMVWTDFARRGVPWVELQLRTGRVSAALNCGWRHRLSAAACVAGSASALLRRPVGIAACGAALVALNHAFYALLARRRGGREAVVGVGLHALHHLTAVAALPAGLVAHAHEWGRGMSRGEVQRSARAPAPPALGALPAAGRASAPVPVLAAVGPAGTPPAPVPEDDPGLLATPPGAHGVSGELTIGLVGCGRLAEVGYLPALRAARGVRLGAVADPDPQRRGRVAGDLPAFEGAGALLAEAAVDALVLASPAAAHLDDARRAVAAGVAVLVEKPPAPDAAGAAALAGLDPAPWVAFNRRFGAGQRAVHAALPATGSLDLRLELCYRRAGWGAHVVGDEALLDLAPHLVDLACWLSGGEVRDVQRATLSHERAELHLALERGRARIRCAADRPHRELIEARDARGALMTRHSEGGLVAGLRARVTARNAPHPLVMSLTAQLEAFAQAVRGAPGGALATAADGHAVMTVLDAARSRATHAAPVAVAA